MSWKFGGRSLRNLEGVHPMLVEVAKIGLQNSEVDFGITCGTRTLAQQMDNIRKGRSKTKQSYHLIDWDWDWSDRGYKREKDGYSHAIDCVAYEGSDVVWEMPYYFKVADALQAAVQKIGGNRPKLQWGCAWHLDDICTYAGDMKKAYNEYVDLRRSQGRTPFTDGPHFQIKF
jgi:peptidoglycan L-alanyl-D-glutamate endopeptidase CwlK